MDTFDLKKFLKENKALENLNPTIKSLNEGEAAYEYEEGKKDGEKIEKKKMTKEAMKKHIKDMIVAELEGGSSNSEKIRTKYNEMFGKNPQTTFKDVAKALNLPEDEVGMVLQSGDFMGGHSMFEGDKITEEDPDANPNLNDFLSEDDKTKEEEDEYIEALGDGGYANFGEAKKKEEEVDVEDVEVTGEEDVPAADAEVTGAEDVPAADGGLEDIAADMEGTEGELMDSLMKAFKIAKGMGNEKLETQVGNTLKFFVSEYIGGGED